MRERRCEGAAAAARCFNLHLSASRPLLVLLGGVRVRPPNGDLRRHSPPTESVTCSGALAVGRRGGGTSPARARPPRRPTEEEHLGKGFWKRAREGGKGASAMPVGRSPGAAQTQTRKGRGRSVAGAPPVRPPVRRPDGRPNERPSRGPSPDGCPSKRTLFQLADGTVAVKMTTA